MDIVVQRILKIGNRCKVSFQILKQHGKKSITQEAAAGKTAAQAEHIPTYSENGTKKYRNLLQLRYSWRPREDLNFRPHA